MPNRPQSLRQVITGHTNEVMLARIGADPFLPREPGRGSYGLARGPRTEPPIQGLGDLPQAFLLDFHSLVLQLRFLGLFTQDPAMIPHPTPVYSYLTQKASHWVWNCTFYCLHYDSKDVKYAFQIINTPAIPFVISLTPGQV